MYLIYSLYIYIYIYIYGTQINNVLKGEILQASLYRFRRITAHQ